MTKVRLSKRSRALLRRLSVVFSDELRLKLVTELYMREMSPKQFHEEFGFGSISRVDRHLKELIRHGWIRYVRSKTGGSRRSAEEHFYRATELAVFDTETWSRLPYSIKVAFSWGSLTQMAEQVQKAFQAGTFDARPDRHFTWTPILLDQRGWEEVIAAVDALFAFIFEEQERAKLRILESGEEPILATVALAAFESPMRPPGWGDGRAGAGLAEGIECPVPFTRRLSKVFADELCLKIVAELNLREMSAPQYHEEFGGASVGGIRRRFKMLAKIGWLKKVDEKTRGKRRGPPEHFYRASGPAIIDNDTWSDLPDSIKATRSWTTFRQLFEQVQEAIEAGTLDARSDRHLTWSRLRLDQRGWEEVIAAVDDLFALLSDEQKSAKRRMAESGEEPIRMTVALAVFESPKVEAKAP